MDPTTVFCPTLACPARGQRGQGTIGMHAQKEQRFLCPACRKTFTTTKGTALYRVRTAADTGALVVTLLAPGCPLQALVVAVRVAERTVAAWGRRAGGQGQAGQAHRVEPPRALGQGQADESRGKQQGGIVWMARAMMVRTRVWWAGEVREQRDLTLRRRLLERGRRCAAPRPLWVCTDGLGSSIRAMRETWRDPAPTGTGGRPRRRPWRPGLIAQVVKRSERRRGVETTRRLVDGTPARVETLSRRAQGAGGINTASSERLNAPFRERRAALTRRGRARARRTLTLQHGMSLIGTVYHFCTPHASLSHARGGTTPAMAAGITAHGWTVQALRSFPVPPPRWTPPKQRGRPSHALKRLIARWCGDHG